VQIVNDGAPAEVEEILALPPIAHPIPLPPTNMSQCVFDRSSFAQFGSSLRGLLQVS
jgi:hypothetical protein